MLTCTSTESLFSATKVAPPQSQESSPSTQSSWASSRHSPSCRSQRWSQWSSSSPSTASWSITEHSSPSCCGMPSLAGWLACRSRFPGRVLTDGSGRECTLEGPRYGQIGRVCRFSVCVCLACSFTTPRESSCLVGRFISCRKDPRAELSLRAEAVLPSCAQSMYKVALDLKGFYLKILQVMGACSCITDDAWQARLGHHVVQAEGHPSERSPTDDLAGGCESPASQTQGRGWSGCPRNTSKPLPSATTACRLRRSGRIKTSSSTPWGPNAAR